MFKSWEDKDLSGCAWGTGADAGKVQQLHPLCDCCRVWGWSQDLLMSCLPTVVAPHCCQHAALPAQCWGCPGSLCTCLITPGKHLLWVHIHPHLEAAFLALTQLQSSSNDWKRQNRRPALSSHCLAQPGTEQVRGFLILSFTRKPFFGGPQSHTAPGAQGAAPAAPAQWLLRHQRALHLASLVPRQHQDTPCLPRQPGKAFTLATQNNIRSVPEYPLERGGSTHPHPQLSGLPSEPRCWLQRRIHSPTLLLQQEGLAQSCISCPSTQSLKIAV